MKVAVLGSGNIGGTLGRKWAAAGHHVTFGVRDPDSPRAQQLLESRAGDIALDTVAGAIAVSDVVLFAVPGGAVDALVDAHADALDGKIIIDAANKISAPEMHSLATFAAKTPGAKVFRAFSNLGWENLAEPQFGALQADLFYCGPDDGEAGAAVEKLIANIGLRPVRVGGLDQAQAVDGVTRLWFALALGRNMGRHLAFKLLTPD